MAARLHAAAVHLSRRLRVEDEALGTSAARLSALSVLVAGGAMRIGALARAERVEPPTMTRLIDALARDGYVERAPDPEDRRAVIVRATAQGTGALKAGRAQRVGALASDLRTLSPAQLTTLSRGIEILEHVID